jgi:hypothetical protein
MKKIFVWGLALTLAGGLAFGQADEIMKLKEKIIELQNKGELGSGISTFALTSRQSGPISPCPRRLSRKTGNCMFITSR